MQLPRRYAGWIGFQTAGEQEAVWPLRAVLVNRVLALRGERVLYLLVGATPSEEHAARVGWAIRQTWQMRTASSRGRSRW